MMNEIKELIEALEQQHPKVANRIPQFLEVESVTQSTVVIDGRARTWPCIWGIVEQDAKWIWFETDDERGYIWIRQEFDTIKEACASAKERLERWLRLCEEEMEWSANVEEFEQIIQTRLPGDYREFLIKSRGDGFAVTERNFTIQGMDEQFGIDAIFGFNEKRSLDLKSWYQEYQDELPEKSIIIGNSMGAGLIVLIWQADWKGVFLWDDALVLEQSTKEDCLYRIADSFKEFRKFLRRKKN